MFPWCSRVHTPSYHGRGLGKVHSNRNKNDWHRWWQATTDKSSCYMNNIPHQCSDRWASFFCCTRAPFPFTGGKITFGDGIYSVRMRPG